MYQWWKCLPEFDSADCASDMITSTGTQQHCCKFKSGKNPDRSDDQTVCRQAKMFAMISTNVRCKEGKHSC